VIAISAYQKIGIHYKMEILYENQYIENSELELYIKENKSLHSYFKITFKGIKPNNYCGFLSINNQSYFIAPKITTDDTQNLNTFIYMLIYAYDVKLKNEDFMQGKTQEHHLLEIFIRLFADRLLEELKKGIFKQYITLQENLKVLRGKYVIEKNFNNFYHQNIYCEFDEFSMDNELNRFFLYAIRFFKKFSSYPNLHRCEAILDEVTYVNVDFRKLNIQFDRMSSRYKQSYEVALMILKKLVPMTGESEDRSFAFLFKMYDVFEYFVGKLYKEIDSSVELKKKCYFGDLYLKPDIYTNSLIIDTKYKSFDEKGLDKDDKYQMFVYGVNFGIRDSLLLYPKHLVDIDKSLELGKGKDLIHLKMRSLDLNFSGGYDEFISKMRERLKEIR